MGCSVTILDRIIERKRAEVADRKADYPVEVLEALVAEQDPPRGFSNSLVSQMESKKSAVIAEIKRASPSKGLLRSDFQPGLHASQYEMAGATCLSVLTDQDFFQGSDADLKAARGACTLPVIRKDFMIDPYQIIESRALGADCILLIVSALNEDTLEELYETARSVALDVLVEVHNREELMRSLPLGNTLVGINNRDLHHFDTDLNNTYQLLADIPNDRIVVTESGIHSPADIAAMREHQVNAFLVGESLMRAEDPGRQLGELFFPS